MYRNVGYFFHTFIFSMSCGIDHHFNSSNRLIYYYRESTNQVITKHWYMHKVRTIELSNARENELENCKNEKMTFITCGLIFCELRKAMVPRSFPMGSLIIDLSLVRLSNIESFILTADIFL